MSGSKRSFYATAVVFLLLFAAGIAMGYLFFIKASPGKRAVAPAPTSDRGIYTTVQVFFPYEGRLQTEERKLPGALGRMSTAKATVEELLKGPSAEDARSYVPEGARLLNIYDGSDGILYIDLSDEFRRNFSGDALAEFLLLRGLYESILSNVYGVAEVKVLIEGAEVDTLGGHISLLRPLGETVSLTLIEE